MTSQQKNKYFNVLTLSWEVYEFGYAINVVNLGINEDIGGLMRRVVIVVR